MEIGITPAIPSPRPAPAEPAPAPEDFLSRFDALAAGESFSFLTDDDPEERLSELRARRPGMFEWSPDLEGPHLWRTVVTRRGAGQRRTVSDALAWDHDRLDALERDTFAELDRGDAARARCLFAEFARGLERHIAVEEAIVFPAFEEATGQPPTAGPTAVMREEHRIIRSLLQEIAAELADPAASPIDRRRSLAWILGEHNAKEEQILYPMTDATLGPDRADGIVRRIQSFRGATG